jgi:hypothetical protein
MMTVFLFFLISSVGLGLLYLGRLYQKLGTNRILAFQMSVSAENGVKQAFGALAEVVRNRPGPSLMADERYAVVRDATAAGSSILAEEALDLESLSLIADGEGTQSWEARIEFELDFLEDSGGYLIAGFRGTALSEGRVEGYPPRRSASLDLGLEILAGGIPLIYFPLLLSGPSAPSDLGETLREKRVEVLAAGRRLVVPGPASAAATLIPDDPAPFLEKALKVKILTPDGLTKAQLRSALGLEMVNEPVPDGVYLIQNDSGLGGVFVQGEVEEMALAVESGCQNIQFKLEEGTWRLRFNPSLFVTEFKTPGGDFRFDRSPLPIVMVNGKILSLGGGIVAADGTVALSEDPSVPCLRDGVSLSIVCSDEVTLTAHLIGEGVRWKDGLPYLKDSQSQLVLYANGRDFVEGTPASGKIKIGAAAPRGLEIHASLTARGGFESLDAAADILIAGGLQSSALRLGSRALRIVPDERLYAAAGVTAVSPRAAIPVLAILSLEPREWRE